LITNEVIDAVAGEMDDFEGLDTKALDQKVSQALDSLDAKHLSAVSRVLSIAALIAMRMSQERQRTEDEGQEREYADWQARSCGLRSRSTDPFGTPPMRAL
jgi:hypothetical protein